jgi:signal transduction histidine kinase
LKSRLQKDIAIVTHYGYLPPVNCFAGQLNQVFMNILGNAVDTLLTPNLDRSAPSHPLGNIPNPIITITTTVYAGKQIQAEIPDSRWVSICIANNGAALSPVRKQQLLDSFSGERRLLKETSLALSYWIVTAKHGGRLELRSPMTEISPTSETPLGTEFEIILPLV